LPTDNVQLADAEKELPIQVWPPDAERRSKNPEALHYDKTPPADPAVQREAGFMSLDTPLVNFEGSTLFRPDATGAAGPNNYVQAVNYCTIGMYSKSGALQLLTSMTNLGGNCSDDPIVLYDKFADRWLISDVTDNYLDLTVAISQTPDPTGAYYIYKFPFPVMPDFPKYSVWTDGYYVTFRNINSDTVGIGVLERDRMLHGDANSGMIMAQFPNAHVINQNTQLPGSPKILSCDGALPAFGKPNYLMYFTNINCGDSVNSIMVYKLHTDTTAKTCVLTLDTMLHTTPFNGYFIGYTGSYALATPGGYKVWSLEGPFQYRVPYIRFTGYNSAVLCNTVNLGDTIAGIRWYELRQNDTTLKWSIYQQSTYGPNDSISRWNSSISMDLDGNISLAYNVTNRYSLYAGIRYTGRLASDPLNQMTFQEQTAMLGNSIYTGGQWGDYSESALDPDGITFWHTNQYIKNNAPSTRIFSFRLTSPTGILAHSAPLIDFKVFQSGHYLTVRASGLPSDEEVVVNLFDINGKLLSTEWIRPSSHVIENKINVSGLATDAYLIRIGNYGFQKVAKVVINK